MEDGGGFCKIKTIVVKFEGCFSIKILVNARHVDRHADDGSFWEIALPPQHFDGELFCCCAMGVTNGLIETAYVVIDYRNMLFES